MGKYSFSVSKSDTADNMNKNRLIEQLKSEKVYIISPHYDDAILSAGMLMHLLKDKKNVTVVNLFTKAHEGPYTLSAKKFLREAKFKNAIELFKDRKRTDKNALLMVGVKHIDINLTDALFRRYRKTFLGKFISELDHVYPTYNYHLLRKIAKKDQAVSLLTTRLLKIIPKKSIVIAPYAIGNHVDHVIARKVCESLFPNIIYYTDFPYNIRLNSYGNVPTGFSKIVLATEKTIKEPLIKAYTSQVDALFENGKVPKHSEIFYLKK